MSRRKPQTLSDKKCFLTRRQMLAMSGKASAMAALFDPGRILVDSLVGGLINKAQADATGAPPRNYVHICLAGGPSRWVWDLPMTPYKDLTDVTEGGRVNNPYMFNRFTPNGGANAGAPQYGQIPLTIAGEALWMPQLWASQMPVVGGGTVAMTNLLPNMLMIRGINMQQDGHPNNQGRQIRPIASAPSLGGRVADIASTAVPAVGLQGSPWTEYKSEKGVGQYLHNSSLGKWGLPLSDILNPFRTSGDSLGANYVTRRDALNNTMQTALAALGSYANSNNPGASTLYSMAGQAETLLKQNLNGGALDSEFHVLRLKYEGLINRCASAVIPNVTDKPILTGALLANQLTVSGTTIKTNVITDLRSMLVTTAPGIPPGGSAPAEALGSTIANMAGSFATIEYLLKNKLSSTIMCGFSGVNNLNYGNGSNGEYWDFDEHSGGSVTSIIANSFMYLALSSCLYELRQVLSGVASPNGGSVFDETVIHIGGEFSRSPTLGDSGMTGSEHGWQAAVATCISGAIKKPLVLGNVKADFGTVDSRYVGTWGAAGLTKLDGDSQPARELTIGNATSTICALLRVNPLMPNDHSMVVEPTSGGGISETIEKAKLVA